MDELSLFDKFGGHYVAMLDGVEVARFAPSSHWTNYCNHMMQTDPLHFTFRFEVTN